MIPSILAILRQTSRSVALYRFSIDLNLAFSSECLRAKGVGSGGVPNKAIRLVAGFLGAEEAGRGEDDGLLSSEKGLKDDRMGCGVANEMALAWEFSPPLSSDSLSDFGGSSSSSSFSCCSSASGESGAGQTTMGF